MARKGAVSDPSSEGAKEAGRVSLALLEKRRGNASDVKLTPVGGRGGWVEGVGGFGFGFARECFLKVLCLGVCVGLKKGHGFGGPALTQTHLRKITVAQAVYPGSLTPIFGVPDSSESSGVSPGRP